MTPALETNKAQSLGKGVIPVCISATKKTKIACHPVDSHVGFRLRQLRSYYGITQEGLAERLGITFQQVQKYESGRNRMSASRIWSMAQVFGVNIQEFFNGLDDQQKKDNQTSCDPVTLLEADFLQKMRLLPKDEQKTIKQLVNHLSRRKKQGDGCL